MKLESTMKSAGLLLLVWLLVITGLAATTFAAESNATAVTVNHLRCEYREDPLGIDTTKPRLSWVLNSGRQSAYQIVVKGLWDSGKILSDQSVNVEYAGKPLESRMRCEWKVRVWDADGTPSAWSAPATWTMGILHPEDWTAQWISTEVSSSPPAPGDKLTIIKATYAALDATASVDVTAHVTKLLKDGRPSLKVDPTLLGGDPALWHVKELRVIYEVNGERREAVAEDFHELILPEPHGSRPDPRDEPYVRRTYTP